jgi:putative membrane protein
MGGAALTAAERARIHAAVQAAEQRTGAHFTLVIVPASDRYALFPIAWAALLALSATGVLALLRPALGIGTGFIVSAALFIALAFLLDWPPLRLCLVPAAIKRSQAHHLAQREFGVRRLGAGRHGGSVLFFVALGERYVEILADRDIHERVAPGTWEGLVTAFIAAAKSGRRVEGFVAAVEACGAILAEHHPAAAREDAG